VTSAAEVMLEIIAKAKSFCDWLVEKKKLRFGI
jgi:hypothetical protein